MPDAATIAALLREDSVSSGPGDPGSAKPPNRALRVAILAALFLLAAVTTRLLLSRWAVDPDSLFHLTSGRWIVQHRAIPTTDVLSWFGSTHATRWLPHEWLFDVVAYVSWRVAGFQGVFALTAALVGASVLCVRRLAEIRGASWLRSLAVALVALVGLARFISPRPGAVTFVLLPLMAILLERDRWIPALLLFVLGMNVHGGAYPIYLLVVIYYASPRRPWMIVAAAALVLAQPLTFGLLKYPFFTLDPLMRYITEFQPTALGTDYLFVAVLVACWFLLDRRDMRTRDLLAAAVLVGLALTSVRNQAFFFVLGLPLLAPYFRLSRVADSPPRAPRLADRYARSSVGYDAAVLAALLGIAALLAASISPWTVNADKGYPRGAFDYVKAHGITRFWNEWNDGGYLMFNGAPPLVDGRADPFASFFNPGVTLALEYMRSYKLETDIRPFLRKYGITDLIVDHDVTLYQVLSQSRDFRVLYRDGQATVFEYAPGSGQATGTPSPKP